MFMKKTISIIIVCMLLISCFTGVQASAAPKMVTEYFTISSDAGTQFSNIQGENNWYYMWGWSPNDYVEMQYNSPTNSWKPAAGLGGDGIEINSGAWCHPVWGLVDAWAQAVLMWKAPKDGTVKIVGNYAKGNAGQSGNGVVFKMYQNTTEIGSAFHKYNNGDYSEWPEQNLTVAAGDKIYFTFSGDGDGSNDGGALGVWIDFTRVADSVTPQGPAVNPKVTLAPGATATGRLLATDPNGDPLTFTLKTQGTKGTAAIQSDGNFSYIANTDTADGADSFVVTASNGFDNGSVDITVEVMVQKDAVTNVEIPDAPNNATGTNNKNKTGDSFPVPAVMLFGTALAALLTVKKKQKNKIQADD